MEGRDSLGDVSIRGKGVAKDTKKAAKMDIEMYMKDNKKKVAKIYKKERIITLNYKSLSDSRDIVTLIYK